MQKPEQDRMSTDPCDGDMSIGRRLAREAEKLDRTLVEPPVDWLIARHRVRKRRRAVITAAAIVCTVLFSMSQTPSRPSVDDRDLPFANDHVAVDTASGGRHDRLNGQPNEVPIASDTWEELLELVSLQTGTQAKLVTVTDEYGAEQRAIYIPERVLPVRYENLSLTEQNAVMRVLNGASGLADSI